MTTDTKPNLDIGKLLGGLLKPKTSVEIKPQGPDIVIHIQGIDSHILFPFLKDLFAKLEGVPRPLS